MLLDHLCEDAGSDFAQHQQATSMVAAACRFFSQDHADSGWNAQILDAGGARHLVFQGHDLGWPDACSDAYLLLSPSDGRHHGNQGVMPDTGIPFVQIFGFDQTGDVAATVAEFVENEQARDTLLHEVIHLLDHGRNPAMAKQRGATKDAYYNSPHEFNAFFHQVAAPLIHFIQAAARYRGDRAKIQALAGRMHISTNFNRSLIGIITALDGNESVREFLDHMDDDKNRRMIKRLYLLHSEAARFLESVAERG